MVLKKKIEKKNNNNKRITKPYISPIIITLNVNHQLKLKTHY